VLASGSAREHIVAFARGAEVLVAVSRWTFRLDETGWGDTVLTLPDGQWTDVLTARRWNKSVSAVDLFGELPVALLERTDD
jgi:(1->4)-alpha-D-glucan 1-alpha-D-glucosylmutase